MSNAIGWRSVLILLAGSALAAGPEYTGSGELKAPANYREWVYLSSGFDMNYNPDAQPPAHHAFDNVFVDPQSYKIFQDTGTWPDKTMLVLEIRTAQSRGSVNQSGNYQDRVAGVELHVKDASRFKGNWAFFDVNGDKPAKMIARTAECYSCHEEHGAVDTTFVQFYPTLLGIARAKGTVAAK